MSFLAPTPEALIQNETFQKAGYLPVCRPECAGDIVNPDRKHPVTLKNRDSEGNIISSPTEFVKEGRLFAVARAVHANVFEPNQPNSALHKDAFAAQTPDYVAKAAQDCAGVILAGNCPMFVVANNCIRIRR